MSQPNKNLPTTAMTRRHWLSGLATLSAALSLGTGLGACGWRIRGKVDLPYKKILLSGSLTPELKHLIETNLNINDVQVVEAAKDADLVLEIMSEQNAKQVLSYNAAGQITAYRIISRIVFRAFDPQTGIEMMPEADIYQMRDLEFNQANIQSFDQMVNDYVAVMRTDIVSQLMRRLSAIKKLPKESSSDSKLNLQVK
jgi:LPS-assembly lipoprotein